MSESDLGVPISVAVAKNRDALCLLISERETLSRRKSLPECTCAVSLCDLYIFMLYSLYLLCTAALHAKHTAGQKHALMLFNNTFMSRVEPRAAIRQRLAFKKRVNKIFIHVLSNPAHLQST